MTRKQSDKHNNMFNVAANLKHENTHENNNWRLVSALSLFVCSVSSQLLLFSLSVEWFLVLTLWLKFVPCSSHRHRHVSCARWVTLSPTSPFTSLTISSSPLSSCTSYCLSPSTWCRGLQPCALPLRSWVPRAIRTPPQVMSPTNTSSQRLMSSSPRSPWPSNGFLKTSTTTTSPSVRRLLNACQGRADHSEEEGHGSGRWMCPWTPRRFQFFSWITFRAASKSGIGYAQHFYSLPEGPKVRNLPENQDYKGFLQKTHWYSRAQSGKYWSIWWLRITKFSVEDVNFETIIDMQSWCKTWPLNGSSRIRAKTKTSQETQRSPQKFLAPTRKPKVIYTDNSSEFGKACEDLSWIHCTSTPHRSETNGIAESAGAQSEGRDICGNVAIRSCETFKISCLMGRHHLRGGSEYHFNGPVIPFWSNGRILSISDKDLSRMHQFGPKVLPCIFPWMCVARGEIWKGDIMVANIEEVEEMDASELHGKRLNAKEVSTLMSGEKFIFPIAEGTVKLSGWDQVLRTSTLPGEPQIVFELSFCRPE